MIQLKERVEQPQGEGDAWKEKAIVSSHGGKRLHLRSKEGEWDGSGRR